MPLLPSPNATPTPTPSQVLLIGKALNFIRLCCQDVEWSLALSAPLPTPHAPQKPPTFFPQLAYASTPATTTPSDTAPARPPDASTVSQAALSRLEYGREAELHSIVSHAAGLANAHLLELLLSRYDLKAHCANLQNFLLLGKGDFAQALMEHISPQLSRPATQLHRHHLLALVESAVRSSASSADAAG